MPRAHARPHPPRHRLRRASATAAALALLAGAVVVGGAPTPTEAATAGHVTGTVFRDFTQNGVFDTTAVDGITDAPLAGIRATAYSKAGVAVGSATTNASGFYDINLTGVEGVSNGDPVRIQFSGATTSNFPARLTDSFRGVANGTTVQFTTVGSDNVNLALHTTTDYSRGTTRSPLITAIQSNGASTDHPNSPAVTAIMPSNAVHTATPSAATTLATFGEVGAVWGTAVQWVSRSGKLDTYYVYASAVVKRHSGFGPRGIAGLYRMTVTVNSDTGEIIRTALRSYDLATGQGAQAFGTVVRDLADKDSSAAGIQSLDKAAYFAVGHEGIGGIAYDAGKLYVVNVHTRNVLAYDVTAFGSSSTTPSSAPTVITFPSGEDDDVTLSSTHRLWAVTVWNDTIYVGVTHTRDSPMLARVISRPVSGGNWALTLKVPLNYSRGIAWAYDRPENPDTAGQPNTTWQRWENSTGDQRLDELWTSATVPGQAFGFRAWAQPILSGLTFDAGGNLVLGFADRFSLQIGTDALWPDWEPTGTRSAYKGVTVIPVGDTLYAGRTAAGTLAIENLGTAASGGTLTATSPGLSVQSRAKSYGPEGPAAGQTARQDVQHGGREFFEDSVRWDGRGGIDPTEGVVHDETTLGAVTVLPGAGQVIATSFDAALNYNNGGVRFMSLLDGHSVDGFDHYVGAGASFGKGGGIGGVSMLLADAPVEIGNRVWYDADGDGIQDADEPAINGAPVELWTADTSGNPVTRLTPLATDANAVRTATVNGQAGTYYFRSEDALSGGTTGFTKNGRYVVVFPKPTSGSPTLVWPAGTPTSVTSRFTGLTWAQLTRAAAAQGSDRLIDSNPDVVTGRAPVTVGGKGENDHSIDAGWVGRSTFRLQKTITGWSAAPPGTQFTVNVASATSFRGDPVTVTTPSYTLTVGTPVTTSETFLYGTTLTFTETGATPSSVVFTGNPTSGQSLLISPTATAGGHLLGVENRYTTVAVTKALADAVTLPVGTTFPVEYQIGSAPVVSTELAVGATLTIPGVPLGATVKLREALPDDPDWGKPFSWGGYVWGVGTWSHDGAPVEPGPDANGWITVTAGTSTTTPYALTLTNHPYVPPALPFTGGLASDAFTIAGGLALVVAVGLGIWQLSLYRRRRMPAHRA